MANWSICLTITRRHGADVKSGRWKGRGDQAPYRRLQSMRDRLLALAESCPAIRAAPTARY
ncbi:hypothetical protein KCP71_24955 [Salmonella enterica subsp. enterica]|nr:hypothetical protein KCP71_24955 [Salmonella enterica subsp. enterica]